MPKLRTKGLTLDEFAEICFDAVIAKYRSSHEAKTFEGRQVASENQRKFNRKDKRYGSKSVKYKHTS